MEKEEALRWLEEDKKAIRHCALFGDVSHGLHPEERSILEALDEATEAATPSYRWTDGAFSVDCTEGVEDDDRK